MSRPMLTVMGRRIFISRLPASITSARPISGSRLQTQSDPPSDDCSESHGCGEVGCELIVAGGDATPILQPAEHALDEIALFVGVGVEGMEALAGWVVGDHGLGATLDQELAQPIAV